MKRDMALIREILLSIECDEFDGKVDGFDTDVVSMHVALLRQGGFVDFGVIGAGNTFFTRYDLTWDGHEFIDSIRQEEVWNTIKTEFKQASVETVFSIGKQLSLKSSF